MPMQSATRAGHPRPPKRASTTCIGHSPTTAFRSCSPGWSRKPLESTGAAPGLRRESRAKSEGVRGPCREHVLDLGVRRGSGSGSGASLRGLRRRERRRMGLGFEMRVRAAVLRSAAVRDDALLGNVDRRRPRAAARAAPRSRLAVDVRYRVQRSLQKTLHCWQPARNSSWAATSAPGTPRCGSSVMIGSAGNSQGYRACAVRVETADRLDAKERTRR